MVGRVFNSNHADYMYVFILCTSFSDEQHDRGSSRSERHKLARTVHVAIPFLFLDSCTLDTISVVG